MADLKLLGLALANAQGGYNAALQGEKDAMAMDTMRRQQQEQMMELALKDAFYEDRQAQMGLELLTKMPVRNERRINQEIALAEDPLMRVQGPMGVGPYDSGGAQKYIDMAMGQQPVRTMDVPTVGLGARMIDQGLKTGQRPQPPVPPEPTAQDSAIQRLRMMGPQRGPQGVVTPEEWGKNETFNSLLGKVGGEQARLVKNGFMFPWHVQAQNLTQEEQAVFDNIKRQMQQQYFGSQQDRTYNPASRAPGRSPQSEMNIVQPLEGDYRPGMGTDGVQQLEPTVVQADPDAENAMNFVSGKFKQSPFTALRNPEFRRMMFDSMARTGSVPGLALQSQTTLDALKGIGDARFLAAKQAATLNQQSQEVDAKLQASKAEAEMLNYQRAADLALKAGDANAERQLRQMVEMFRGIVDVYKTTVPRPKSGGSKEDPNAVDFRKQLNQIQTNVRASVDAQIKALGGFVSPERRAKIMKDVVKNDPTIGGLAAELRAKAGQYPAIANNYSGLFSELGMPLGTGGLSNRVGNSNVGPRSNKDRIREALEKKKSAGASPKG